MNHDLALRSIDIRPNDLNVKIPNVTFIERNGHHTLSYQEILAGKGFGLEENRVAVETVAHIRTAKPEMNLGECHPFLVKK